MKAIWKFTLPYKDEFELEMPAGAIIKHVAAQGVYGCIWAEVQIGNDLEKRKFRILVTGHSHDLQFWYKMYYLGTFMLSDGDEYFVGHLYEVVGSWEEKDGLDNADAT